MRAAQAEFGAELASIAAGLTGALDELRGIARGIHPAILTGSGLAPALKALIRRPALPVELHVRTSARLPEPVEVSACVRLEHWRERQQLIAAAERALALPHQNRVESTAPGRRRRPTRWGRAPSPAPTNNWCGPDSPVADTTTLLRTAFLVASGG